MYIGLDIGTSGTKASLIQPDGTVLRNAQISYGFCNTRDGCRELDPKEVWKVVTECLKKAGKDMPVKTITVSSLGEAMVPVNPQGEPLSVSITGTDQRGTDELAYLVRAAGREHLTDVTGLNLSTIYSANKLLWIRRNQPELFKRTWKFMTFQDYVVYRLSGTAVIDYSMASRTMLFALSDLDWSEELLKAAGLERKLLSTPVPAGTVAGSIRKELAEELGLPPDVKIVAGTHDHICNALGCGVAEKGSCADTVGTTEGLTAVLTREQLSSEEIEKYQISCEPFAVKGLYNTVAWNNTSGVLLKWFVTEFVRDEKKEGLTKAFARMNQEMKPEPTGLLVLPHFSGAATPYMDSASKGVILGLTLDTKREEVYKALMEGANLELALILSGLTKAGLVVDKVVATGGALSPELLQIKADILALEIQTVREKQTGTLGGAILGAVAAGDFPDIRTAAEAMVKKGRSYEPDTARSRIYREKLELYREVYPSTAKISHRI